MTHGTDAGPHMPPDTGRTPSSSSSRGLRDIAEVMLAHAAALDGQVASDCGRAAAELTLTRDLVAKWRDEACTLLSRVMVAELASARARMTADLGIVWGVHDTGNEHAVRETEA